MTPTTVPDPKFKSIAELLPGKILTPSEEGLRARVPVQPDAPAGFSQGEAPLDQLPNYEKLSRFERFVQDRLPGWADTGVGRALQKFAEGPFGRVLQVLDVGAEAVERATGLATQTLTEVGGGQESWQEYTANLGAAWYAGSLAADMSNLPQWEGGKLIFPTDLPGVGGLTQARDRIIELTNAGAELPDALEQTRAEVYESQGALALRMQMHDAFFHIAADPLNIALGVIKPVTRVQRAVMNATRAERTTEGLAFAVSKIDELVTAGEMTSEAATAARAAYEAIPKLSPVHQTLLRLAGVDPVEGALGGFLRGRLNPFRLTPEARAHELAVNVTDNVMAQIAARDPEEAVRLIGAAFDGTYDPRVAHMIVSHEGATVRAALTGFSAEADQALQAWRSTANGRNLLGYLAQTVGEEPAVLLGRLRGPDMVVEFNKILEKTAGNQDELMLLLKAAGIEETADATKLAAAFEKLASSNMLTKELFQAQLMNRVADLSTQFAVAKYGVKATGFVRKLADSMKAAESLAFMRVNPTYFLRNLINGEFSMLARGGWSLTEGAGRSFWERMGAAPVRLKAGFGMAGEPIGALAKGPVGQIDAIIREATVGKRGWVDRAGDIFRKVDLGPADMVQRSGRIEGGQRFRAMSRYAQRYMREFHELPGMPDELRDILRPLIGDDGIKDLRHAATSALNDVELDTAVLGENVNLSVRGVLDGAKQRLGTAVDDVIPLDEAEGLIDEVTTAWRAGGETGARDAVERIRARVEARYSASLPDELAQASEAVAGQVAVGGTPEAARQSGRGMGQMWADAHYQYAQEIAPVFEQLRQGGKEGLEAAWDAARSRGRRFWEEKWSVLDSQHKAVVSGLKRLEAETGQRFAHLEEVGQVFKGWKGAWEDFWKARDTLIAEFVEARKAGKSVNFEAMTAQIDELYAKTSAREALLFEQSDNLFAQAVPDQQRTLFLAGRQEIRQLNATMRDAVQGFRSNPLGDGRRYIDLTKQEQIVASRRFWQERMGIADQIAQAEQKHAAAMGGSVPEAARAYETLIQNNDALRAVRDQFETMARAQPPVAAVGDLAERPAYAEGFFDEWYGRVRAQAAGKPRAQGIALAEGALDQVLADAIDGVAKETGITRRELLGRMLEAPGDGQWRVSVFSEGTFNVRGPNIRQLDGKWPAGEKYIQVDVIASTATGQGTGTAAMREVLTKALQDGRTELRTTIQTAKGRKFFDSLVERGWLKKLPDVEIRNAAGELELRYPNYELVPDEILKVAPEVRAVGMTDPEKYVPSIFPHEEGMHNLWYQRGGQALDAIRDEVLERGGKKPLKIAGLGDRGEALMRGWVDQSRAQLSSSKLQAMKFGEFGADSALLNYNRRLQYNNWLGTMLPFEFWTTTSVRMWAIHSLERPWMLANFLRLQKFIQTGMRPESGFPERMRGRIRIKAPFLPDYLGDTIFIDPFASALPFKQWEYGLSQYSNQQAGDERRQLRVLDEMLSDGTITEAQHAEALMTKQGSVWDHAAYLARQDNTENRKDAFDFASLMSAPHAPITWAFNAIRGTPEKIGPFLPLTRTIKGITAALGIGPNGGVNIEGAIRKHFGLPAFDQWEDYRTNRMLANMVADGVITAEEAKLAMVSRQGEAFEEGVRRAGVESAVGTLGAFLGIPTGAYPPGEEHQRQLQDDYARAWEQYDKGDDTALNEFNRLHPEYEARRLALEMKPEDQLRSFLVDEIWSRWGEMPSQDRRNIADGLGGLFQQGFLDKETRSIDNIPADTLTAWLSIMGGEIPGKATWNADLHPIELAPRNVARGLEAFYVTRTNNFRYNTEVAPLMDTYFAIEKGPARKAFLREHQILNMYWEWRNDFMQRNPTLAPYIEDDPKKLPQYENAGAVEAARAAEPNFTWVEWQGVVGLSASRLILDAMGRGGQYGEELNKELEFYGEQLGLSPDALFAVISQSRAQENR